MCSSRGCGNSYALTFIQPSLPLPEPEAEASGSLYSSTPPPGDTVEEGAEILKGRVGGSNGANDAKLASTVSDSLSSRTPPSGDTVEEGAGILKGRVGGSNGANAKLV